MKEISIKSYPIKRKDVRTYFIVCIILLSLGISLLLLMLIIFPYALPFFLSTSIIFIGWGLVGIPAYYFNPEKLYLISIGWWKRKKYRKQREQQREQLLGKGCFMDCFSCGKNFKNQNFNYCPYCGALL